MTELRAPDPTLTACDGDVVWVDGSSCPQVAHNLSCVTDGDPIPVWTSLHASAARWFAVPCRECFPDAPPPGYRWLPLSVQAAPELDPHLAWQSDV